LRTDKSAIGVELTGSACAILLNSVLKRVVGVRIVASRSPYGSIRSKCTSPAGERSSTSIFPIEILRRASRGKRLQAHCGAHERLTSADHDRAGLLHLDRSGLAVQVEKRACENAVLRHQVTVLQRKLPGRIQLTNADRLFFVQLYRWFPSILKIREEQKFSST
jgi:hypothetical protein